MQLSRFVTATKTCPNHHCALNATRLRILMSEQAFQKRKVHEAEASSRISLRR